MTRNQTPASCVAVRSTGAAIALAAFTALQAHAADITASGRLMAGNIYRVQDRNPDLLTMVNARAAGLAGQGSGGNADDANLNYARGDAASRAVRALVEVAAVEGIWSGLVRAKAWHDAGLSHDGRPWGNVANSYAAGAPLSDSGAPRLSRFSGLALLDAWVQGKTTLADVPVLGRAGQQTLAWGERSMTPGGLEVLSPRDWAGLHRAAPVAAETLLPRPMLFGRIEPRIGQLSGVALEAYYQTSFRPSALDVCGTLWSMSDYLADGCDRVMSGQPMLSDRARIPLGAYQKRLPTPKPAAREFGFGATWRVDQASEFGLYHARYNARTALPGLRRSSRPNGPALIPDDPDGRNMVYFTEYAEGLRITAATFSHKRAGSSMHGEVSYRPAVPLMLAPGDVLPAFMSATTPSLLRARRCGRAGRHFPWLRPVCDVAGAGRRAPRMGAGGTGTDGRRGSGRQARARPAGPFEAALRTFRRLRRRCGQRKLCGEYRRRGTPVQPARVCDAERLGLPAAPGPAAAAAGAAAGGQRQPAVRARRERLVG